MTFSPDSPREPRPVLSVVIPAYNEQATLRQVVETVLQLPCVLEVIVVDDCSQDATPAIVADLSRIHPQVRGIRHEIGRAHV